MIEVVSPGNKSGDYALRSFTTKSVDFIRNGINFVVVDLFPPTPRDPDGIHQAIWDELVGDPLPDAPLFLAPGWYVNIPLEATYQASWAETPLPIRELVETSP